MKINGHVVQPIFTHGPVEIAWDYIQAHLCFSYTAPDGKDVVVTFTSEELGVLSKASGAVGFCVLPSPDGSIGIEPNRFHVEAIEYPQKP